MKLTRKRDRCFEDKIEKTATCWNFKRGLHKGGYGQHWANGGKEMAHRFSYKKYVGEIPTGMFVLHKCDNRKCVNPSHLFLGTQKDNIHDMIKKGRRIVLRGDRHGSTKLTDADVLRIREMWKSREMSQVDMAIEYGVHKNHIQRIVNGRRRK